MRATHGCSACVTFMQSKKLLGEGDTYEEALADVKSAIQFHVESFGSTVLEAQAPVLEALVAEAGVEI